MQLRNLWLTIGFGLVMLVIVASLMPNPPDPAEFKGSDKLEHFATYAFMMGVIPFLVEIEVWLPPWDNPRDDIS
jgi:hypothetical protein